MKLSNSYTINVFEIDLYLLYLAQVEQSPTSSVLLDWIKEIFCRASYKEYDKGMKIMAKKLMDIIIGSLNMTDKKYFAKYLSGGHGLFHWNYYPTCPEPHMRLGMHVHTDFTLLTVLCLEVVGGLKIQKGGSWIVAEP